jgi:molybdenum cofactor cytidylyltransferase
MNIYGLLLAAGQSVRMGQPKQLLSWRGQPLVAHIAAEALAVPLTGLVVVVGAAEDAVRAALRNLPVTIVPNPDFAAGLSTSLATGLRALPATADAAMILLVDQPLVTARLMRQLINAYQSRLDVLAVIPRYRGQRGNPVIIAAPLFNELYQLSGDSGARTVLERYSDQICWLDVDDPAVVTDVDTPAAWQTVVGEYGQSSTNK